MLVKYWAVVSLLCMGNTLLLAQQPDNRPEESDILIEQLFIEATKEKILQNYDEAIVKYLEVLQQDPNSAVSCYELARLYDQQKELDKAILKAEQATTLEPSNTLYAEQYATILEQAGNFKKIADLYENLVKKYPQQSIFYEKWAYYLIKDQKPDQAIKVYNSLEKQTGIQELNSMRKYQLYMELNKDKKAKQELDNLYQSNSSNPAYRLHIASFYVATKDYKQANEWYKKTLEVAPDNPTANAALVEYFLQSGDTLRYLEALAPIFADHTQDFDAKIKTLEPLSQGLLQGNYRQFESQIYQLGTNMIAAHPQDPKANLIQAELLYYSKKYDEALPYYQAAIEVEKNDRMLWQRFLATLYQQNSFADLGTYGNEMLELFPSQPEGYYYAGIAQLQQQKYKEAVENLEYAADIAVTNPELQAKAMAYLGQAYVYDKSYEAAQKTLDKVVSKAPNNLLVKQLYANSLALQGTDLSKALDWTEKALKNDKENPVLYTTQAIIYYKQAKYEQAATLLSKAYNLGGSGLTQTLEYAGDTAFRLGKTTEAVRYWQEAVEKGATSATLNKKIETKQLYE